MRDKFEVLTDGGTRDNQDSGLESSEEMEDVLNTVVPEFKVWKESREDHEKKLWGRKTRFEKDLSRKAIKLENSLEDVQELAEQDLDDKLVYKKNLERGEYGFEQYEGLGLSSFINVLSEEAEKAHSNYRARGEKMIELKDRLDELDKSVMRETLDKPQDNSISFSDIVRRHISLLKKKDHDRDLEEEWEDLLSERRRDKRDNVRGKIRNHLEKSREDHIEFLNYFNQLEQTYDEYFADVESYMTRALPALEETNRELETVVSLYIPDIEESFDQVPEDYEKMIDGRRKEIEDSYNETVDSLGTRATEQYRYVENALTELRQIEDLMTGEPFKDVKKSDKLGESVDKMHSEESYWEHLEKLTNTSIDEQYPN